MSTMKKKEVLRGPGGLKIELDATEIFPDDPGNGTPALVVHPSGVTGTFWCVNDTGEIDGLETTPTQRAWLDSCENAVNQWVEIRSAAIKRDGRDAVLAALV